ncbi:hypothetical protein NRP93_003488 [Clostridium botulinum]|nr:hypothetical protein [Clostridium botulinum]
MGDTMKELVLSKWVLLYPDSLSCIFDESKKKVVFLTKEYDEIHLVVEVVSEKLVFQPRWNVVITELDKFKYEIKTNS